ncbi:aspartate kinase [Acidiferrimicrobium sp. IK]|uniref:aspartate kinase n=1 Tax=Acidiferrimicrobium sp. IK TaxID=2871700 RepID=UPI0021CB5548|nr:aspartate kinase [Acidiferrimicrobium sp. IK]MCU4186173.1 aspartate kinase [Acidiferrimicrobium sp. IK]
MALVVQKFGGTSVGDGERMRTVADYIARTVRRGNQVVVAVSAMGKETDQLLHLASEVSATRPGREMDMLITAGERKAMALLCMALHDQGIPADSFTGSQAGIVTDTDHTRAKIVAVRPDRIRKALDAGRVPVVGGAQGVSVDRDVTFLGRGGTDTTAVALAKALDADACEIYTDVSGVFNADPRIVPEARRLKRLSFEEMLEMNAAGCPKPAMRSVEFARNHGVRLHVRSAFTWEPGTWITEEDASMEQAIVSAVVSDSSEAKLTVTGVPDTPGIAARLFRALADRSINVDMVEQNVSMAGTTDISFTVPHDDLSTAHAVVDGLRVELGAVGVTADPDIATVSIIGAGMKTQPGVTAAMFETLAAEGINIEMISTSAIRLTCVIRSDVAERAVVALHKAFELEAG